MGPSVVVLCLKRALAEQLVSFRESIEVLLWLHVGCHAVPGSPGKQSLDMQATGPSCTVGWSKGTAELLCWFSSPPS